MAKDKFSILNDETIDDVQSGAHLQEATPKKEKKNQMVYGIPVDLANAIEESGESLSGYFKRAAKKMAREEGII